MGFIREERYAVSACHSSQFGVTVRDAVSSCHSSQFGVILKDESEEKLPNIKIYIHVKDCQPKMRLT